MVTTKKMEEVMSMILIIGTFFSAALVMIGGTLYLLQNGGQNMQTELLQNSGYHISLKEIWLTALSFTPVGMIELGLLSLVATQIVRVGLLAWFYTYIRDYWFACISLFILIMLIYSFVLRS